MACINRGTVSRVLYGLAQEILSWVESSRLFRKNCAIQEVLKIGTLSLQMTFAAFYLQVVAHRCMDTFSVGLVVAAQEVM